MQQKRPFNPKNMFALDLWLVSHSHYSIFHKNIRLDGSVYTWQQADSVFYNMNNQKEA